MSGERRLFSDWKNVRDLVVLRGLGYEQCEIARKIGCTQSTVSYQLKLLRSEAEKHGQEALWRRIFPLTVEVKELR